MAAVPQLTKGLKNGAGLGEKIVALGGHPTVSIEARWEPEKHKMREMLEINLNAERDALKEYKKLLKMVPKDDVALDEKGLVYIVDRYVGFDVLELSR